MNCLQKLEEHALRPKQAFYSRLKNENISDEDYTYYQRVWRDNNMKTMRDFLEGYNNRDVGPFLEAIAMQFDFYRQREIDMFKDGISVPGLTLLYLFNDLPPEMYFTVFNETNKDLHKLLKDNIVGGPSVIFHRFHEKEVTNIRQHDYGERNHPCKTIVGNDANALYLWALIQDMPTGWYTRRREENTYRLEHANRYGRMAVEWLSRETARTGNLFDTRPTVRKNESANSSLTVGVQKSGRPINSPAVSSTGVHVPVKKSTTSTVNQ